MIGQMNIYGNDKVEQAILRLQTFEPPEGYYLAFSGGKDSVVIKALADMAGVKYDAHYNVTSVDPPELYYFIRDYHPDVAREIPYDKNGERISMWSLIRKMGMPPTRINRYCCAYLKETRGEGRFVVTGVRRAESVKRSARGGLEVNNYKTKRNISVDPDNPTQEVVHACMQYNKRILNPIIDWDDAEVWEFIHEYNIPYCSLYDEGFKRLGCVGCPMAGANREKAFERWPKFKKLYIRTFDRMIQEHQGGAKQRRWEKASWGKSGKGMFDKWMGL